MSAPDKWHYYEEIEPVEEPIQEEFDEDVVILRPPFKPIATVAFLPQDAIEDYQTDDGEPDVVEWGETFFESQKAIATTAWSPIEDGDDIDGLALLADDEIEVSQIIKKLGTEDPQWKEAPTAEESPWTTVPSA
jgi:hypothetical protein